MRYSHAAFYVFWLGLVVTLYWAAVKAPFLSGLSFLLTVAFTAEAFIVAKAEDALPAELGHVICRLGFFSATACARNPGKGFENISLSVDARHPRRVRLNVRTKDPFWNAKIRAEKMRKKLSQIVGLQDVVLKEQDAVVDFHDEPDLRQSVKAVLVALGKLER